MLSTRSLRAWTLVHKWTSLVCTAFLLLLCLTGLPLIFYEEIEHLTGRHPEAAAMPEGTPAADLDGIVAAGLAAQPGHVAQYLSFEQDAPLVGLLTGPTRTAEVPDVRFQVFDARTAEPIAVPRFDEGIMWIFFKLHVDLFAGLPGMLFLGFMGLLFVAATVSGVVIYAPFMRKLDFGTVRAGRSRRLKWLDLHNLLGIVTLAWVLVVGVTGVINTLADPIRMLWQQDQMAELTAPYAGQPPVGEPGSVQAAVRTALAAAPGMTPSFVAWPGTAFSSPHHYGVFLVGDTPLTSRLYTPALVDAATGELTAIRAMPWYVTALFVSQPLHFGDYGGMPLKIIWALLDVATIIALGSGLYLWLARRRAPVEARLAESDRQAAPAWSAKGEPAE